MNTINAPQPSEKVRVWPLFCQAWREIHGVKGPLMSVFVALALLTLVTFFLIHGLYQGVAQGNPYIKYLWLTLFTPVIQAFVTAPFYAGCLMVPINRVRNVPLNLTSGYHYFHRYVPTAISMLIIALIVNVVNFVQMYPAVAMSLAARTVTLIAGMVVTLVITFLLNLLFIFTIPLVVDKSYSVVDALKTSACCVLANYWRILLLFLCLLVSYLILPCLVVSGLYFIYFAITHKASALAYLIFALPFMVFIFIWGISHHNLVIAELYCRLLGEKD